MTFLQMMNWYFTSESEKTQDRILLHTKCRHVEVAQKVNLICTGLFERVEYVYVRNMI